MAYINLSLSTKLARLNALNDAIGANATLVVYDSIYPASPDVPVTVSVTNTITNTISNVTTNTTTTTSIANTLVSFPCNMTAFGNVAVLQSIVGNTIANVVSLTSLPFPPVFSTANGIATWARIYNANGVAIIDLDVGMTNAGTSIIMNSTDLVVNIPVQVISINISEQ